MISVMNPNQPFQQRRRGEPEDWQVYTEPPMSISSRSTPLEAYSPPYSATLHQHVPSSVNPIWSDTQPGFFCGHVSSPSLPGSAFDEAELQVPQCSNISGAPTPSASSSTAASPQSHHGQIASMAEWPANPGELSIAGQDFYPGTEYQSFESSMDELQRQSYELHLKGQHFDAAIIHHEMQTMGVGYDGAPFPPPPNSVYPPPSPAISNSPQPASHSPYPTVYPQFQNSPYQNPRSNDRRLSTWSSVSHDQPSHSGDESGKEKQRCSHPDCEKLVKDMKAHMLTHQAERPEKCPITTCDYHIKGFARKYDKNRHTLTHYKGTMVCGFCPGSGSANGKTFNRADVFKRHLTAVHGVDQASTSGRKKTSPSISNRKKLTGYPEDATGKCSTCSATFSNAQDFYEHLDDCVLRIVQQEDPAEKVNSQCLAEVESDKSVVNTLIKNNLLATTTTTTTQSFSTPTVGEAEEDDIEMEGDKEEDGDEDKKEEDGEEDDDLSRSSKSPVRNTVRTGPSNGIQKSRGLTHSRGGVLTPSSKARPRKNRRNYPSSWGYDKGHMTMKKRVMAVFDGARRLAKDDMMLSTEHEIRVQLPDGKSYVTDLDVQTMKRAEGFHQASDEEKGPWISDDPTEENIQTMMRIQQEQQEQKQAQA